MKNQVLVPSVNFHLWEPCNMRCKFCFATFQDVKKSILPKGHLPKEQAIEVVEKLAQFGFEKITFAGGEPTLCPWLHELIQSAKSFGMTTMIVTNGSNLSLEFLERNKDVLDWIALSVDSMDSSTNLHLGRAVSGHGVIKNEEYKQIVNRIKAFGYGLKINTVVNQLNKSEDLTEFIIYSKPKRWKILQVMTVIKQNDNKIDELLIRSDDFHAFVDKHKHLNQITKLIPETVELIRGSYAMVDPAGRFFDSSKGLHNYSRPILEIGVAKSLKQVEVSIDKFKKRNGYYKW